MEHGQHLPEGHSRLILKGSDSGLKNNTATAQGRYTYWLEAVFCVAKGNCCLCVLFHGTHNFPVLSFVFILLF